MSGCSCLFSDVLELRCNIEILRYGMGNNLSHNSIQTAFKISDLALQAITLLIIQRVSNTSYCSYAEHLLPIGSSRIRLLEQTDAQAGSTVQHMVQQGVRMLVLSVAVQDRARSRR